MSTKKLQLVNSLVKQAENADKLDGKHADEFATIADIEELSSQIGDDSVPNQINVAKTELTEKIDEKAESSHKHTITDISDLNKGSPNGVAELDSNGKILSSQLPSYVDDVIEGYLSNGKFYEESTYTTEIIGEDGKIYIDISTNKTYRWSGTVFVTVSETIALGETSSTAYRGDRGKVAYDHSQLTSGNPHGVTKSDVGLGNVENKSSETIRGELTKANVTTALGYTPPTTNTTYSAATTSAAGLMSAADKTKLDGIATRATNITVDSALSSNSTNPVQNKVINTALAGKAASSHTHNYAGSPSVGGAANALYLPRVGDSANYQPSQNQIEAKEFSDFSSDIPTAHWYHILTGQSVDANYATQLALGMTKQSIYFRNKTNGSWNDWKQLPLITVLYNNSEGDNTSETITLSDSAANYDMIEVVYGHDTWASDSAKSIVTNGATRRFCMSISCTNTDAINIITGMCVINGTRLYRGTALATYFGEVGSEREKRFALNWGTSGTLATKTTVYTASNGFGIRIHRVIGYKS